MVNRQQAGKTWPGPHPHAVIVLQGLIWDQHYRHSNPQCEGGFPETFELKEDMGADRLQALEDWLQPEGYGYLFRQRRWRVWRLKPSAGEGLCLDGYEDEVDDNEYRPGERINVSVWDVIEKEVREPGQERKLRKSPGDKKRPSGDKKRDKKWKEFQEFQASQARALVPIGEPATPERPRSSSTPGEDAMADVHMGTPEAHPAPATSSSSDLAASSSSTAAASSSSPAREPTTRSARSNPDVEECGKRAEECERCTGRPCHLRERQRLLVEQQEQRKRWTVKEMTERKRGVEAWPRGIEGILAREVAQRAEALNAEMVREIEVQEAEKEEAEQAARMAAAQCAQREQEADASHQLDVELLKRPLCGPAEEYGRRFPSTSRPPATAPEDNMIPDDIEVKSGSTVRDERSKGENKGKKKTKMRAKPQQSEEEYYTTCEDRDFSDFRG